MRREVRGRRARFVPVSRRVVREEGVSRASLPRAPARVKVPSLGESLEVRDFLEREPARRVL